MHEICWLLVWNQHIKFILYFMAWLFLNIKWPGSHAESEFHPEILEARWRVLCKVPWGWSMKL